MIELGQKKEEEEDRIRSGEEEEEDRIRSGEEEETRVDG